jgi:hypothetical protein
MPSWRFGVLLVMALTACQGDKSAPSGLPLGKERGDCKPNKVCDPGLICLSNLCVRPPPADCQVIADQLASMDLGNYAEVEERAPVVAKYKAACDKAYVSKEQGECFEKATDKATASACAPAMFPELTSSGSGDCVAVAAKIRGQMSKQMGNADPQTKQMFDKMIMVMQQSCDQDAWPDGYKKCVLMAGDANDAMSACQKQMPDALQKKMTERMMNAMK